METISIEAILVNFFADRINRDKTAMRISGMEYFMERMNAEFQLLGTDMSVVNDASYLNTMKNGRNPYFGLGLTKDEDEELNLIIYKHGKNKEPIRAEQLRTNMKLPYERKEEFLNTFSDINLKAVGLVALFPKY